MCFKYYVFGFIFLYFIFLYILKMNAETEYRVNDMFRLLSAYLFYHILCLLCPISIFILYKLYKPA